MKNLFANTAKLIKDAINKRKYQLQEMAIGLKDQHPKSVGALQAAVGLGSLVIIGCGSAELAAKLSDKPPKRPSMELELEYVPNTTQNTTTSDIEQAVTEALTQNTTEEPTYTTTVKPVENTTEPVVTTIPVYTETDIVATETTTYYVDPTTNTVKTTTTTRQPSTQATTTKKQTTATTPKQTTKVTTTTTQPVTQAPTDGVFIPYSLEEIAYMPAAFDLYAQKLNKDLLKGNGIYLPDFGPTFGGKGAEITLAMLNEGKISDVVLKEIFKEYTAEEIYAYREYVYNIAQSQDTYGTDLDFTKYTLDKKLGNYLNSIDEAARNDTIENFIYDAYIVGNIPSEYIKHPAVFSLLCSYDKNKKYISTMSVDYYCVDNFIDNICKITFGKTYTK